MTIHHYSIPVLFSLMFTGYISGQTAVDSTRPRLTMRSADVVNIIGEGDNEIWKFTGNVLFEQGDAHIKCSRATFSKINHTADFYGPVTIFDGKRTLTADRVNYNGDMHTEEARGNVVLVSKNHTLTAAYVKYNQDTESAEAEKNVVIVDLVEDIELTGDRGFYRRTDDYGKLEGRAAMTKIDSLGGDSLNVFGGVIEAWGDSGLVNVRDSVRIEKDKMQAFCHSLTYLADNDSMSLKDDPVVWQEDQKMTGDEISLLMVEMELKKGWINGNGRIESTDSLHQDVMTGKQIYLAVESDSLRRIIVRGQATSVYHVTEDEKGVNSFTGDIIRLIFHDRKLHRLLVESSPGFSTGLFTPEKRKSIIPSDSTTNSIGNIQ